MALPEARNLTIYQGDTFRTYFRLRERNSDGSPGAYVDLTGVTAKAQIRLTESTSAVLAEFTTAIPDQTGDNLGRVDLELPASTTATLTFGTVAKWDVQLTYTDGVVQTYLKGDVKLVSEVTRA